MRTAVVLAAVMLAACARLAQTPAARGSSLEGTWRLVSYESPTDRQGMVRVENPDGFTMILSRGGRVAMHLSCSSANGTWTHGPADDTSGTFGINTLTRTRTLRCPPDGHDDRIIRDAPYVETYALRNGRLYMNILTPQRGSYVWEPAPRASIR